ncbi:MFS transporter [Mongoliitalea daihaiensis]|uniref:MFS transporter n=1 Tax=Mongoliitalea daihaiensis TaxID=2782006 RepID=UPI001F379267|nr:MFS transporter [Mongoliitalea daihaiensis]UJP63399.1 MFS transporter [Mongoliitalea daihaiensis]
MIKPQTYSVKNAPILAIGFFLVGFICFFIFSTGPIIGVSFSELFSITINEAAILFVGFINSLVSDSFQQIFSWDLDAFGSIFFSNGLFAVSGMIFIILVIPETNKKSLEALKEILIKSK